MLGQNSVKFAHEAVKRNCVVIDNSSAFRMDASVPLVVPEINPSELDKHQGIIANPNCSSAIALMAIYPLHKRFGLKKFSHPPIKRFRAQVPWAQSHLTRKSPKQFQVLQSPILPSVFPHPIAFNLIPHVDQFREDGYTKEELKMCNEARKILTLPNLKVSCTCVRVPVYRAHSISINAEFIKQVNLPDAIQAVSSFTGLILWRNLKRRSTPCPFILLKRKLPSWQAQGRSCFR